MTLSILSSFVFDSLVLSGQSGLIEQRGIYTGELTAAKNLL